eukprot:TRINITY_DN13564_c0_g1_i1.p1 TRINITY_DN13564_c0_g1~~TRINITY_DN13564_c0_g1_i1.p1  ORF type:complete len:2529 (-),score=664.66 TRINITY_DN13564_c0_g1_i1:53-7279(-)
MREAALAFGPSPARRPPAASPATPATSSSGAAGADGVVAEFQHEQRTLRSALEMEAPQQGYKRPTRQDGKVAKEPLAARGAAAKRQGAEKSATRSPDCRGIGNGPFAGRLQAVEEAVLGLGQELLGFAELQRASEDESRRLGVQQEALREALVQTEASLSARLSSLEGSHQKSEASLGRLQKLLAAQTQGSRGLSEDLSCVVEEVESRLRSITRELESHKHRLDEAFGLDDDKRDSADAGTVTVQASPLDKDTGRRSAWSVECAVASALRSNPRRQPSEAARLCHCLRAWKDAVDSGSASSGSVRPEARMPEIEQELQHRFEWMEQRAQLSARCEVLRQREELCSALGAELHEAELDRMQQNSKEVSVLSDGLSVLRLRLEDCEKYLLSDGVSMEGKLGEIQGEFQRKLLEVSHEIKDYAEGLAEEHEKRLLHGQARIDNQLQEAHGEIQKELSEFSATVRHSAEELAEEHEKRLLDKQAVMEIKLQEMRGEVQEAVLTSSDQALVRSEVQSLARSVEDMQEMLHEGRAKASELENSSETAEMRTALSWTLGELREAVQASRAQGSHKERPTLLPEEFLELHEATNAVRLSQSVGELNEEEEEVLVGGEVQVLSQSVHELQGIVREMGASLEEASTRADVRNLHQRMEELQEMVWEVKSQDTCFRAEMQVLCGNLEEGGQGPLSAELERLSQSVATLQEAVRHAEEVSSAGTLALADLQTLSYRVEELHKDAPSRAEMQASDQLHEMMLSMEESCVQDATARADLAQMSKRIAELQEAMQERKASQKDFEDASARDELKVLSHNLARLQDIVNESRSQSEMHEVSLNLEQLREEVKDMRPWQPSVHQPASYDLLEKKDVRIFSQHIEELREAVRKSEQASSENASTKADLQHLSRSVRDLQEASLEDSHARTEAQHLSQSMHELHEATHHAENAVNECSLVKADLQRLSCRVEEIENCTPGRAEMQVLSQALEPLHDVASQAKDALAEATTARADLTQLSYSFAELQEALEENNSSQRATKDASASAKIVMLSQNFEQLQEVVHENRSQSELQELSSNLEQLQQAVTDLRCRRPSVHQPASDDSSVKADIRALFQHLADLRDVVQKSERPDSEDASARADLRQLSQSVKNLQEAGMEDSCARAELQHLSEKMHELHAATCQAETADAECALVKADLQKLSCRVEELHESSPDKAQMQVLSQALEQLHEVVGQAKDAHVEDTTARADLMQLSRSFAELQESLQEDRSSHRQAEDTSANAEVKVLSQSFEQLQKVHELSSNFEQLRQAVTDLRCRQSSVHQPASDDSFVRSDILALPQQMGELREAVQKMEQLSFEDAAARENLRSLSQSVNDLKEVVRGDTSKAELQELSSSLEQSKEALMELKCRPPPVHQPAVEASHVREDVRALSQAMEQLQEAVQKITHAGSEDATARADTRRLSHNVEELQEAFMDIKSHRPSIHQPVVSDTLEKADIHALSQNIEELREEVAEAARNRLSVHQPTAGDSSVRVDIRALSRDVDHLREAVQEIEESKLQDVSARADLLELSEKTDEMHDVIQEVRVQQQVAEDALAKEGVQMLSQSLAQLQEVVQDKGETTAEDTCARAGLQELTHKFDELSEAVQQIEAWEHGSTLPQKFDELSEAVHEIKAWEHGSTQKTSSAMSELHALASSVEELRELSRAPPPSQPGAVYQGRPAPGSLRVPSQASPSRSKASTPCSTRPNSPNEKAGSKLPQGLHMIFQDGTATTASAANAVNLAASCSSSAVLAEEVEEQAEGLAVMRRELKLLTFEARQSRNQGIKASAEMSQALMSFQEHSSQGARNCHELHHEFEQLTDHVQLSLQEQREESQWLRSCLANLALETKESCAARFEGEASAEQQPQWSCQELAELGASLREELQEDLRSLVASRNRGQIQRGDSAGSLSPMRRPMRKSGQGVSPAESHGEVAEVLLLHFPEAEWPAPPGFQDSLALRLRSWAADVAAKVSLRLLPREAGLVAEARGPSSTLDALQRLPLQDLDIHSCRCSLVWRSWASAPSAATGSAAGARPQQGIQQGQQAATKLHPSATPRSPASSSGSKPAAGSADDRPRHVQGALLVEPPGEVLAEELKLLKNQLAEERCLHRQEWAEFASGLCTYREEGAEFHSQLRALSEELQSMNLAAQSEPETRHEAVNSERIEMLQQLATMGPWSSFAKEWSVGFSELSSALRETWEVEDAPVAAVPGQSVQAEQLAFLQESVVELRGSLSVELWEVRRRFSEEFAAQAADFGRQLSQGWETSSADLDGVRADLAEVVGDSVELRKQLLALCKASEESKQRDHFVLSSISDVRHTSVEDQLGGLHDRWVEAIQSVDVLGARQEAAEQNSARGLALLQQAIQTLATDQEELRRAVVSHTAAQRRGRQHQSINLNDGR